MTAKMKFPRPNPQLKKIIVVLLSVCAVVMLVLLAASLPNLEFKPAQVFFLRDQNRSFNPFEFAKNTDTGPKMTTSEMVILIVGLLVLFILAFAMLSQQARRRMIYLMLRMGLTLWAILWLMDYFRAEEFFKLEAPVMEMDSSQQVIAPPPPYAPPDIPAWVTYIFSLLFVLLLGVAAYYLWRFFQPGKRPLRVLANVVRSTLKDLSAGRDWDDIAIQCYARMIGAVEQNRGLRRQQAMTPREFAGRMERAGLPSEPVRRLTRLFEKARYGERESNREDMNEAVSCLTAILHAMGERP